MAGRELPVTQVRQPRRGEQVLEWAREVTRAVRALEARVERGAKRPWPRSASTRYNQLECRSATYNSNSGSAEVTVEPGNLQEVTPGGTSVRWHPFKWNGNTHLANTVISIASNQSLYATWQVEKTGNVISNTAVLEVAASNYSAFPHWYPDDPLGDGNNGNVYVKLFEVTISNTNAVTTTRTHDGNPVHYQDMWTGQNVGDGANVYKQHDEDANIYEFRAVSNRAGYTEDDPDDGTTAQIKIAQDGDDVRVIGNGKTGVVNFKQDDEVLAKLAWNDGLWLNSNVINVEFDSSTSNGLTCDVVLHDCWGEGQTEDNYAGFGAGAMILRMSFETGLLVAVNKTSAQRAMNATLYVSHAQSCHFCDDVP